MSKPSREQLAKDIKDSIQELAKGRYYPDLLAAIDELATLPAAAPGVPIDAFRDVLAHLAGAASAYRTYAKRHASKGKAETDAFFSTRADDFDKAVERGRAVFAKTKADSTAAAAEGVEAAIQGLVTALAESKGWMRGYAEAIIRDAIDRRTASQATQGLEAA